MISGQIKHQLNAVIQVMTLDSYEDLVLPVDSQKEAMERALATSQAFAYSTHEATQASCNGKVISTNIRNQSPVTYFAGNYKSIECIADEQVTHRNLLEFERLNGITGEIILPNCIVVKFRKNDRFINRITRQITNTALKAG